LTNELKIRLYIASFYAYTIRTCKSYFAVYGIRFSIAVLKIKSLLIKKLSIRQTLFTSSSLLAVLYWIFKNVNLSVSYGIFQKLYGLNLLVWPSIRKDIKHVYKINVGLQRQRPYCFSTSIHIFHDIRTGILSSISVSHYSRQ